MKASAGSRILMLLENFKYPQDGRVRREALALVKAGHQVIVIAPGTKDQTWSEEIDGVFAYRYPAPREAESGLGYLWEYGYSLLATAVLTVFVFARHGFDVIHAHSPPDMFVFIAAFYKLLGKKFVFDHHDLSPEMYRVRFTDGGNRYICRALELCEILSCRLADHVIATNESYKRVEVDRSGIPPERVTIVRNGPELDRVRRVAPDDEVRRKAAHIIGYVGCIGFQDGLDYLIRALRHLKHDLHRDDFYCVIVGNGAALDSIRDIVHALEMDEHVLLTDFIPHADLLRYLSSADIFVDPDPSNPFNDRSTMIKMLEYMALERPIVAFDLPEHRVSAGEAALYAQPNDERDFAEKIATLMNDPDLRRQMGAIGRQRIDEQLAWPFQANMLVAAYARLLRPQAQQAADRVASSVDSELPVQVG